MTVEVLQKLLDRVKDKKQKVYFFHHEDNPLQLGIEIDSAYLMSARLAGEKNSDEEKGGGLYLRGKA